LALYCTTSARDVLISVTLHNRPKTSVSRGGTHLLGVVLVLAVLRRLIVIWTSSCAKQDGIVCAFAPKS